jgi:hypothetical protein
MDYHPEISVFRSCPSSISRNAASHNRILGRILSRHPTPIDLLSGQATWLRCPVLDESLAIPWCQNLACNTAMRRSRPGLRSSLWSGSKCLSSAPTALHGLMLSFCTCSIFFAWPYTADVPKLRRSSDYSGSWATTRVYANLLQETLDFFIWRTIASSTVFSQSRVPGRVGLLHALAYSPMQL